MKITIKKEYKNDSKLQIPVISISRHLTHSRFRVRANWQNFWNEYE